MLKNVIIVGGGTAGWLTAAYLARRLNAADPRGISVTVVESPDIPTIGVGEGSFPSILKTLSSIGFEESELLRECHATFKQGIRFANWLDDPSVAGGHHYYHPFQPSDDPQGLDLLPYWLLGAAKDRAWAAASSVQKHVADANLGPKLSSHPPYAGPLAYAYHFDAQRLGQLLRRKAVALGCHHIVNTVSDVELASDGAIAAVTCGDGSRMVADLYVDCTGFRAQLIGQALGMPFVSRRKELFCNRAVAIQLPYRDHAVAIASQTFATAQRAGWIWDIGLHDRRGTGYVYSSDHEDDENALQTLRAYLGPDAASLQPRFLQFDAGYRRTQWHKNCIAVGLSSGFIEPLEATGIGFAEMAAQHLVNLFPWGGDLETSARQFNTFMNKRYDGVVDFIKLHYFLSRRSDSQFWLDNRETASASPSLLDRLERWRFRVPDYMDIDLNNDIFLPANWQYVLYGMDYKTDLRQLSRSLRYFDEAARAFADIRVQQANALSRLPEHRQLLVQLHALRN